MRDREPRCARRPRRSFTPQGDGLESRQLLTGPAVGRHLGTYLSPATYQARASTLPQFADPRTSVNQFLSAQLGSGLDAIQTRVQNLGAASRNPLADSIVKNSFVKAVLSRQDTYTLLSTSSALVSAGLPQSNSSSGQSNAAVVNYNVPTQAVITAFGPQTSTVHVLPTPALAGFVVQVPTSNIQIFPAGSPVAAIVSVPVTSFPSNVPTPAQPVLPSGQLSDVYASTASLLSDALRTATPRTSPTTPHSVPGLRLVGAFNRNHNLPNGSTNALLRVLHLAVDRQVFNLNSTQQTAVMSGLAQFQSTVSSLAQAGAFTPATPVLAPTLPSGPLNGTMEVTVGAFRNLADVAPGLNGLQLPNIANFPGRIDSGFAVDRFGNFGLVLTARGPLGSAPTGNASPDLIGGDVQIEVSNAPNLAALGGQRTVEGVNQGTALSAALATSSNAAGVSTFATSVGYGSGFEFGTGLAYTQVIPLGNVYSLIPSAPPA